MRASTQDGSYPRPMLCREEWTSLDGTWQFAHDDDDLGLAEGWFRPSGASAFDREIEVPYPPESPASGVEARGFHPIVWYRRVISRDMLAEQVDDRGDQRRVLLHFGAVDHRAQVWVDGQLVASHVGGQTPFSADLTDTLDSESDGGPLEHVVVVRAQDDPAALSQPRGKQDWTEGPHDIWYERTTGIWQSVWLEIVPRQRVTGIWWSGRPAAALVGAEVTLAESPSRPLTLEITLTSGDEFLAQATYVVSHGTVGIDIGIPALRNGQDRDRLTWAPENPHLIDAEVILRERHSGEQLDLVTSYLGLREVGVGGGAFLLNGRPHYTRSVLNQGYRHETHLAARDTAELRGEVELIKAMGFNAVRMHQKAEDPRFLYWADRLGLLVWGETAGAYEFSSEAIALLTREWMEIVGRDRSHPCVVVWVPVNESWGVQDIAAVPAQQQFAQALVSLTRALDPSRPAVSNEGWEHVDSDIVGIHDYTADPDVLRRRYLDRQAVHDAVLTKHGPAGRRILLSETQAQRFREGRAPLMITEFGGVSMSEEHHTWGYDQVSTSEEYADRLSGLFGALQSSTEVVGFCYTQFMDTGQETNGLLDTDRVPKLPIDSIRRIVSGEAHSITERVTFGPQEHGGHREGGAGPILDR